MGMRLMTRMNCRLSGRIKSSRNHDCMNNGWIDTERERKEGVEVEWGESVDIFDNATDIITESVTHANKKQKVIQNVALPKVHEDDPDHGSSSPTTIEDTLITVPPKNFIIHY